MIFWGQGVLPTDGVQKSDFGWTGLDWTGLDWDGLGRIGLGWVGLVIVFLPFLSFIRLQHGLGCTVLLLLLLPAPALEGSWISGFGFGLFDVGRLYEKGGSRSPRGLHCELDGKYQGHMFDIEAIHRCHT